MAVGMAKMTAAECPNIVYQDATSVFCKSYGAPSCADCPLAKVMHQNPQAEYEALIARYPILVKGASK